MLRYRSPMASDGQQDWVELYRGALMELDRTRLPQKIEAANAAIQRRLDQLLASKDGHQEHWLLKMHSAISALSGGRSNNRQYKRNSTHVASHPPEGCRQNHPGICFELTWLPPSPR